MQLPGPENRQRLLTKLLANLKIDDNLGEVVAVTDGLSHADLEAVVKAAVRNALGRALDQANGEMPRSALRTLTGNPARAGRERSGF